MFDSMKTLLPGAGDTLRSKTFAAPTFSECLLLAKQELGAGAVILSSKTVRKGGLFGRWGGQDIVQVTFGIDPAAPLPPKAPAAKSNGSAPALNGTAAAMPPPAPMMVAPIAGLSAHVQISSPAAPAASASEGRAEATPQNPYPALLQRLLQAEVAKPLARDLCATLAPNLSDADAQMEMHILLSGRVRIAPPNGGPRESPVQIITLVGPTGSGKTATLAKLMARGALTERRSVGVVTLDTHRFSSAQELASLGDLLQVPIRMATDRADLVTRLTNFFNRGVELVLLDTPGISPNDLTALEETAGLLRGMEAVQRLLAIPATMTARDMDHSITRFQKFFAPEALVLTKIDEATDNTGFGRMFSLQEQYELPLAYLTTGQWVPDDIALPDAVAIASRILAVPSVPPPQ